MKQRSKIGTIFLHRIIQISSAVKKSSRQTRSSISLLSLRIKYIMSQSLALCSEIGKFSNTDERSGAVTKGREKRNTLRTCVGESDYNNDVLWPSCHPEIYGHALIVKVVSEDTISKKATP